MGQPAFSIDDFHGVLGLAYAADRLNTNPISDVVSMKRFKKARFHCFFADSGGTGDGTLKLQASAAFDGSSPSDIPFRYKKCVATDVWSAPANVDAGSTVAITAGVAAQYIVAECRARDLPNGLDKVFAKLTEVTDEPVPGIILIELLEPDLAESVYPTQIA